MRILLTGATSTVSRGMIPILQRAGHEIVLHDIVRLPDNDLFRGIPFVQGDIQAGIGLERAAQGCDLIIHTPAWHGIHWRDKTEADFWRLNVDGTFWTFQAAVGAGIERVVFLSSMAWYGHYDKYGFTKQLGEELCEYYRRNHAIRFVAIRPHDFTPWGSDYTNRYGARLLHGGVDWEDVLDCTRLAVEKLTPELPPDTETEKIVVQAVRANAFTEAQIADWTTNPLQACECIFPGATPLIEKYKIRIEDKPSLVEAGEGAAEIGYTPRHHFGTFLDNLRKLDNEGGESAVAAMRCPY
ncbi:MAG: NAD(P)-dependent oxidoreductase [Chthonomonadaceae bacterium]|nr:NAD(P)-dependent oxidoreductase [Chthonomonadaceae bacterium]